MTTYDEVWRLFLSVAKMPQHDLPNTDRQIYDLIEHATLLYNNEIGTNITTNEVTETFDKILSGDEKLIIAHYIRLMVLQNQLTFFQTTYQPFAKDITMSNFNTQLRTLQNAVRDEEQKILDLLANSEDDFL